MTVSDGQLTAKTEVYVNIESPSGSHRGKTRFDHTYKRMHTHIHVSFNRSMPSIIYIKIEIFNSEESGISLYIYEYSKVINIEII